MSQSNAIFGFLAFAFVVFITQRGELPIYLGFLLANPQTPATIAVSANVPAQQAPQQSSSTSGALSAVSLAADAFALL